MGVKFFRLLSKSLNYLARAMEKKTPAWQWHRATHRAILDLTYRCQRRTAAEEFNLAKNDREQDVTAAGFVRTF